MLGLKLWPSLDDVPTEEEYLARKAYLKLIKVTSTAPPEKRAWLRGNVAKNLIRDRYNEGNYKQAEEMWKVFNKRLPKYVTEEDRPAAPGT